MSKSDDIESEPKVEHVHDNEISTNSRLIVWACLLIPAVLWAILACRFFCLRRPTSEEQSGVEPDSDKERKYKYKKAAQEEEVVDDGEKEIEMLEEKNSWAFTGVQVIFFNDVNFLIRFNLIPIFSM